MQVWIGTARGAGAQYAEGSGDRSGRASALSLRPVLWYAWALIQPPGWLMAGFVDLDQRLCGCLIIRRGASYCAGDVSGNEGFPLAAWANRAYGDDTGRLAGSSDKPGRFWVPWAWTRGAVGVWLAGCVCVVL